MGCEILVVLSCIPACVLLGRFFFFPLLGSIRERVQRADGLKAVNPLEREIELFFVLRMSTSVTQQPVFCPASRLRAPARFSRLPCRSCSVSAPAEAPLSAAASADRLAGRRSRGDEPWRPLTLAPRVTRLPRCASEGSSSGELHACTIFLVPSAARANEEEEENGGTDEQRGGI